MRTNKMEIEKVEMRLSENEYRMVKHIIPTETKVTSSMVTVQFNYEKLREFIQTELCAGSGNKTMEILGKLRPIISSSENEHEFKVEFSIATRINNLIRGYKINHSDDGFKEDK